MIATTSTLHKLLDTSTSHDSLLCLGLDPDLDQFPRSLDRSDDPIGEFNRAIIEATADVVCAYKLNAAFYEVQGLYGWQALEETVAAIPPHLPVILDAKRGDIGNTARRYAISAFDQLGVDAITINPYLGRDGIQPFLDYADKLTFLLAATSNPGADDLQSFTNAHGLPLYRHVARMGASLHGRPGAVGLVAGATRPERLAEIRAEAPALWLLVPGIGAQGGDLSASLRHGLDANGGGLLVTASRSLLYASQDTDFAAATRLAAMEMNDAINRHRR